MCLLIPEYPKPFSSLLIMTRPQKHPIHKHPFHRLGCKYLCGVCLTWHSPLPGQSMGGRRHPASGGVDGLCNKNTRREPRKEDWQRGSSSGSAGTHSVSPRSTSTIAFLKTKQHTLGYTSVESSSLTTALYATLWFFSNRHGEITVLYPSLTDWSESPPYSALPRPGVEPLENNRQLYSCVFHVANTQGRQVEHKGFSFCANWRNKKVRRFEETASGRGWERLTRSDGAARRMSLSRIRWSHWEGKADHTNTNQTGTDIRGRCLDVVRRPRKRAEAGGGGGQSFVKYLIFPFQHNLCAAGSYWKGGDRTLFHHGRGLHEDVVWLPKGPFSLLFYQSDSRHLNEPLKEERA